MLAVIGALFFTSRVSDAVEVIESVPSVCLSVCVCVCVCQRSHDCVCRFIMAKGLWGEGTLQHWSREVRQRSGVFMDDYYQWEWCWKNAPVVPLKY